MLENRKAPCLCFSTLPFAPAILIFPFRRSRAFNRWQSRSVGVLRCRSPIRSHIQGPSGASSSERWYRSLTARSSGWNNAGNSPDASRCRRAVSCGIWLRSRHGSHRGAPGRSPEANKLMFVIAAAARSEARIGFEQRHRRRYDDRRIFPAIDPGVDGVGPFLRHVATLNLVLGLVIDAA